MYLKYLVILDYIYYFLDIPIPLVNCRKIKKNAIESNESTFTERYGCIELTLCVMS